MITVLVSASTQAAFLFRALESGVEVTGDDGDLAEEEVRPGDDSGSALAPSSEAAAASVAEFSLSEEEEAPSASSSTAALFSPSSIFSSSSPFPFSPFSRAGLLVGVRAVVVVALPVGLVGGRGGALGLARVVLLVAGEHLVLNELDDVGEGKVLLADPAGQRVDGRRVGVSCKRHTGDAALILVPLYEHLGRRNVA